MDFVFQINISNESENVMVNGGLEAWTGSVPDGWTTDVDGGSVLASDTKKRPESTGTYSAKMTISAGLGDCAISQIHDLKAGVHVKIRFWYVMDNRTANIRLRVRDSGGNVYLNEDGGWETSTYNIIAANSFFWRIYEIEFVTHEDYAEYEVLIRRDSNAASTIIWVDDVEVIINETFAAEKVGTYSLYAADIDFDRPVVSRGPVSQYSAPLGVKQYGILMLSLDDTDGYFKSIISADGKRALIGKELKAFVNTTSGLQHINTYAIERSGSDSENTFTIEASEKIGIFREEYINRHIVTREGFPLANPDVFGKPIAYFFGHFKEHTLNASESTIQSWCVNVPARKYILGRGGSNVATLDRAYDPDGVNIASATLVLPSGTDIFHYINTSVDRSCLQANFTYTSGKDIVDLLQEIQTELFPGYEFNTDQIGVYLAATERHYEPVTTEVDGISQPSFAVTRFKTAEDVLKEICESFALDYYICGKEIVFKLLAYDSLLPSIESKFFQQAEIQELTIYDRDEELLNQALVESGYDFRQDAPLVSNEFQDNEGIEENGVIKNRTLVTKWFRKTTNPEANTLGKGFFTAKHIFFRGRYPRFCDFVIDTKSVYALKRFDTISIKHERFGDEYERIIRIEKFDHLEGGEKTRIYGQDVTWMTLGANLGTIDFAGKCLIQADGKSGQDIIFDTAPDGHNQIETTNITHTTSVTLFGATSLDCTASNPSLAYSRYRSANLEWYGDLSALDAIYAELHIWIQWSALGVTEYFWSKYKDTSNYVRIFKRGSDNKIEIEGVASGVPTISMVTDSAINNTGWNHFYLYRDISGVLALYINGSQESYSTSETFGYTIDADVENTNNGNSGGYFNGYLACVYSRLGDGTWFDVTPNSGKTDSFDPPWGLYSSEYRKYYKRTG